MSVLEHVADLLGDDAIEPVLGVVDLLVEVVEHLLRQLHLLHEVAEVLRPLGETRGARLDRALEDTLEDLGDVTLEEALPVLVAAFDVRLVRAFGVLPERQVFVLAHEPFMPAARSCSGPRLWSL